MARERDIATFTCPRCARRQNVLADEVGTHGCICGWDPVWEESGDEPEDNE